MKDKFLKILEKKLYKNFDSKILNENINIYSFIKICCPEKLDKYIEFCKKNFISILEQKKSSDELKDIEYLNYLNDNKIKISEAVEELLNFSDYLSLLKKIKLVKNNFKVIENTEYSKEIKLVYENDGLILINTTDRKVFDNLIMFGVNNFINLTILTDDENKKKYLENYIKNEKIEIVKNLKINKMKKIDEKLEKLKIESLELMTNTENQKYISNNIDSFRNEIKKIEEISKCIIGDDLEEFIRIIEKINSNIDVSEVEIRNKIRNEKDENEKNKLKEILKNIKRNENNILTEEDKKYIKNHKIDEDIIKKNYKEIVNLYNNIIENKKIILCENLNKLNEEKNNLKHNKSFNLFYINVNEKKEVKILDEIDDDSILFINNIEKYKKFEIEGFISQFKKCVLVGNFFISELFEIYNETSLLYKI